MSIVIELFNLKRSIESLIDVYEDKTFAKDGENIIESMREIVTAYDMKNRRIEERL
jgi:hypothetical protein